MLKHKAVIGQYIRWMGRTWELLSEAVLVRHAVSQALVTRWGRDGLCSPLQGAGPLCCSVLVFQLHGFFLKSLTSYHLGFFPPELLDDECLHLHKLTSSCSCTFFTMRVPVLRSFSRLSGSPVRSCLTCCSSRCAEDEVNRQKERAGQSSCVAVSKLLETNSC